MHCTDEFDLHASGRFDKVKNLSLELELFRMSSSAWMIGCYERLANSVESSDTYGENQKSVHHVVFQSNNLFVRFVFCVFFGCAGSGLAEDFSGRRRNYLIDSTAYYFPPNFSILNIAEMGKHSSSSIQLEKLSTLHPLLLKSIIL